jgi:hypothetical protein
MAKSFGYAFIAFSWFEDDLKQPHGDHHFNKSFERSRPVHGRSSRFSISRGNRPAKKLIGFTFCPMRKEKMGIENFWEGS